MRLLALDLGTKTGIAHNLNGDIQAETLVLATAKEVTAWGKTRETRRRDPRVLRFYQHLCSFPRPDVVVFEDVQFSSYTLQVQMWASLRTSVWLAFGSEVTIESVPVTTLKKFATGAGNADKVGMKNNLHLQHPEWKGAKLDDNAVDALWLFYWGLQTFSRMNYDKN